MAERWRVKKSDGKVYGNADTETFTKLIKGGKILADDLVAPEGSQSWVKCSQAPAFSPLFAARANSPPARKIHQRVRNPGTKCPQCRAALEPDAVLCVSCGTDLRTGSRISTEKSGAPAPGAALPGGTAAKLRFPVGNLMDTETTIPVLLLAAALIIFLIAGFLVGGVDTAGAILLSSFVRVFFVVLLGIPACFLVAKILGTSFGQLHTAVLKLAAIAVAPPAAGILIPLPFVTGWVGWILYFALLEWLFDLEFYEAIVFTLVLGGMQILTVILIARYILTALGLG